MVNSKFRGQGLTAPYNLPPRPLACLIASRSSNVASGVSLDDALGIGPNSALPLTFDQLKARFGACDRSTDPTNGPLPSLSIPTSLLPTLFRAGPAGVHRAAFGPRGPTMRQLTRMYDPALVDLLVPGMVMTR